jgi:hypothetical protein
LLSFCELRHLAKRIEYQIRRLRTAKSVFVITVIFISTSLSATNKVVLPLAAAVRHYGSPG